MQQDTCSFFEINILESLKNIIESGIFKSIRVNNVMSKHSSFIHR